MDSLQGMGGGGTQHTTPMSGLAGGLGIGNLAGEEEGVQEGEGTVQETKSVFSLFMKGDSGPGDTCTATLPARGGYAGPGHGNRRRTPPGTLMKRTSHRGGVHGAGAGLVAGSSLLSGGGSAVIGGSALAPGLPFSNSNQHVHSKVHSAPPARPRVSLGDRGSMGGTFARLAPSPPLQHTVQSSGFEVQGQKENIGGSIPRPRR
jgi:hypothetical protein